VGDGGRPQPAWTGTCPGGLGTEAASSCSGSRNGSAGSSRTTEIWMSITGLAGSPGTEVEPMWSMRIATGPSARRSLPPAAQRPELARAVVLEPDKYLRGGRILGVEFDRIAHRDPARFHG
jgi:hypothetical protein